ncbi:TolC family protein [Thiolapillus sp.]
MKISSTAITVAVTVVVSNPGWANTAPSSFSTSMVGNLMTITRQALKSSPEIQAAQSAVAAAKARLKGAALPLNNPEFEAETERTDINTYQLGVSQTIDWHDKRSAYEQVARAQLQAAGQELRSLRMSKGSELLATLGNIAAQSAMVELSQRKTSILSRFSKLAGKRHAAGDISQSELELARLSLAEAQMQHARDLAALIQAKSDFFSLSGQDLREDITLPDSLAIEPLTTSAQEKAVRQHPDVQLALLQAQIARASITAADRERKADPTVGVSAGREDDNTLLAFRFSIPIQVRNNYQNKVDAVRHDALQAEQLAQQKFWELRALLRSSEKRFTVVSRAWKQWLTQGRNSLQKRIHLLETLWHTGEISTTDYLLQVQQTLDTQASGIKLQADLWSAWLAWMTHSTTLSQQLKDTD